MKREKATEEEKGGIKNWLASSENPEYQKRMCPIPRCNCTENDHSYCRRFFPKMISGMCPCTQFSISYVKKVAKELIRA